MKQNIKRAFLFVEDGTTHVNASSGLRRSLVSQYYHPRRLFSTSHHAARPLPLSNPGIITASSRGPSSDLRRLRTLTDSTRCFTAGTLDCQLHDVTPQKGLEDGQFESVVLPLKKSPDGENATGEQPRTGVNHEKIVDVNTEAAPARDKAGTVDLHMDSVLLNSMRRALQDLRRSHRLFSASNYGTKASVANEVDRARFDTYRRLNATWSQKLLLKYNRYMENPALAEIRERAQNLTVRARQDEILDMVENNTYSIVVAETGSGKSTQIPQIILNNAILKGSGSECRVLCVVPRRIAATSLAQRVAYERGEEVFNSVSYCVRFAGRIARKGGTITYCTTGILLRFLQLSPHYLDSVSHIILDEVHERNVDLDLLMLLLKRAIERREGAGRRVPKVIVMSATLEVDLFSSYFQNKSSDGKLSPAPHICIPGRSFAVNRHYLGEVLDSLSRLYSKQDLEPLLSIEGQTVAYLKEQMENGLGLRKEQLLPQTLKLLPYLNSSKDGKQPHVSPGEPASGQESKPILPEDDPLVPWGLICATIFHLLSTTKDGSILVFLPGITHILNIQELLHAHSDRFGFDFSNPDYFRILPLHSYLPNTQTEAFESLPPNCRRIFLSTNIAEASITLPDVKYVVDSGKMHEMLYDPNSKATKLACRWISQSSVSQRAGRAGRVQNGEYFAMFSEAISDSLRLTNSPEITRIGLHPTCLRAKKVDPDAAVHETLQRVIEPPDTAMVSAAVRDLRLLQAFDEREDVTPLGDMLHHLPLEPAHGKLVLLGIIFRCLDPLLIVATLGREPFFFRSLEQDARKQINQNRIDYSDGTQSDDFSVINAFKDIRQVWYKKGRKAAYEFAVTYGIRFITFRETLLAGNQIVDILERAGILPRARVPDPDFLFGGRDLNTNSWRIPLVKALLLSGSFRHLAAPSQRAASRYITEEGSAKTLYTSVNGKSKKRLLTYNSKHEISGTVTLLGTTEISPLTACLFGGRLKGKGSTLTMDSWLDFMIKADEGPYAARLVTEFRKALELVSTDFFVYLQFQKR